MSRRNSPSRIKRIILIGLSCLLVISLTLGLAVFLAWNQLQRPVNPDSSESVEFSIEPGTSTRLIAKQLVEQGLIRHADIFRAVLVKEKLGGRIQAGDFQLSQAMSTLEIARALTQAKDKQFGVTLLEGWRREEVAEALVKAFTAQGVSFDAQVFLALPETKEGYLFPDTYFFTVRANEQSVAKTIEANFNQKLAPLKAQIEASQYNLNQILTMASIVERETRVDRPLVAGILLKRYLNDWPLQADATLQYAKGFQASTGKWWPTPLAADKDIESPYNTYKYQGLPPAPIANPSLTAIQATLEAQIDTPYWYYITDNNGQMHYATTYDQHLQNINRYLR